MSKKWSAEGMVRTVIDIWEGAHDIKRAARLLDDVVVDECKKANAAGRREMREEIIALMRVGFKGASILDDIRALPDITENTDNE